MEAYIVGKRVLSFGTYTTTHLEDQFLKHDTEECSIPHRYLLKAAAPAYSSPLSGPHSRKSQLQR